MQFTEKVPMELGSIRRDASSWRPMNPFYDYRIGFIAPCVCREIPYDD